MKCMRRVKLFQKFAPSISLGLSQCLCHTLIKLVQATFGATTLPKVLAATYVHTITHRQQHQQQQHK